MIDFFIEKYFIVSRKIKYRASARVLLQTHIRSYLIRVKNKHRFENWAKNTVGKTLQLWDPRKTSIAIDANFKYHSTMFIIIVGSSDGHCSSNNQIKKSNWWSYENDKRQSTNLEERSWEFVFHVSTIVESTLCQCWVSSRFSQMQSVICIHMLQYTGQSVTRGMFRVWPKCWSYAEHSTRDRNT